MMADHHHHHQSIMCEVEIQPDIQECVEIESIPVDMSDDTCEDEEEDELDDEVECHNEPLISMQSLEGRDIILEAQEEIIDDSGDPLNIYDVPVPDAGDLFVESESPGPSVARTKRKTMKTAGGHHHHRGVLARRGVDSELLLGVDGDMHVVETKPRKWEQKQVQIKTMEGEFSVTMWASGTSDGESRQLLFIYLIRLFIFVSKLRFVVVVLW